MGCPWKDLAKCSWSYVNRTLQSKLMNKTNFWPISPLHNVYFVQYVFPRNLEKSRIPVEWIYYHQMIMTTICNEIWRWAHDNMGHVITTRDPYQMAAKVLKLPMPIVGRQLAFTISSPQYKYFWQDIKYHHSPNFGRPKQGQTFVVPTFHIHFLNPECVRIPWVLAPRNFPIENFLIRSNNS